MLARQARSGRPLAEEAGRLLTGLLGRRFEPDAGLAGTYDEGYGGYQGLVQRLRG